MWGLATPAFASNSLRAGSKAQSALRLAGVLVARREMDARRGRLRMVGPEPRLLELESRFELRDGLARPPHRLVAARARWHRALSVVGWSGPNFACMSLRVDSCKAIASSAWPASSRAAARFPRVNRVSG